ncbi:SIMPL domain-containing protein [Georgenia sp. Z1344]|uniref:SIMPL domain-containing protein n=1 Tax=Georgenia sp. Z1344 TaxID=3416706 RepID=UPI003CF9726C
MAVINVDGLAARSIEPERATVHLTVSVDGKDRAEVVSDAGKAHASVVSAVETLVGTGEVTTWSADNLRIDTTVDWVEKGTGKNRESLPVERHRARSSVRVSFQDLTALGTFAAEVGAVQHVRLNDISWSLTKETRLAVMREIRTEAAIDARERAVAFADALELGPVTLSELTEGTFRYEGGRRRQRPRGMSMDLMMSQPSGDTDEPDDDRFDLRPSTITVSTEVSAVFATD